MLKANAAHSGDSTAEGPEPTGVAVVGEALPKAMDREDMMRAFGISDSTFLRRQRAGEFRPFLLPRPIGNKKYSGEKVQSFLNGRK